MVKGEHLRPLLGFVVVCSVAALILATGAGDPATLRRVVTGQQVLSSPSLTELVLGRTFVGLPRHAATQSSAHPAPAAAQPSSLVVASLEQPRTTTSEPAGHTHAASAHHHQLVVKPVAVATAPSTPATPTPPTPPTNPVVPTAPVAAAASTHHELASTRWHTHAWGHHSRGAGVHHGQWGDHGHPTSAQPAAVTHPPHQAHQAAAAATPAAPQPGGAHQGHGQGGRHDGEHSHGGHR